MTGSLRTILISLLPIVAVAQQTRGNIDWTQLRPAARQGTGTKGVSFGGGAIIPGDYAAWDPTGSLIDGPQPSKILAGTHAARPLASTVPLGSMYQETDRAVLYQVQVQNGPPTWFYIAGQMLGTLSPNTKPVDLGRPDAGFVFAATDYVHSYRWDGAAWHFAPGDQGSQWGAMTIDGTAPKGGLWQLCDGTTVGFAQDNGTITNIATPNLSTVGGNFPVMMAGGFTGGLAAASPTWAAGAKTDNESAHTHDLGAHTHAVTVVANTTVQSGTGSTIAGAQVDTSSGPTPNTSGAGSAHQHNLTNANAVINSPGEVNGGMPYRAAFNWYLRR